MSTRKKSSAVRELEKMRGKSLSFGDLLYAVRTTSEMGQVELAAKVGTTKAKICDFEKERRVPTLELAARIAKALGHSEALFVSKIIEKQISDSNLRLEIEVKVA